MILGTLVYEGISGLSLAVFTEMTPPPGSAGGLLNPIIGSLMITVIAVAHRDADRHPGRHLHGRIRPIRQALHGGPLHQRHPAERAVDRDRPVRLRDHGRADGALLRLGRRGRARRHRHPGRGAHHRGHAGPGPEGAARGRDGARHAARPRDRLCLLPGRPRRHDHRRAARGRPHQRRDGAALVHRAQQPVLRAPISTRRSRAFRSSSSSSRSAPMRIGRSSPGSARSSSPSPCSRSASRRVRSPVRGRRHELHGHRQHRRSAAGTGGRQGRRPAARQARGKGDGQGPEFLLRRPSALKTVNVPLYDRKVTAFIGPSGCGKSTLLRILNRIYDLYPNQRAEGEVLLDGQNILEPGQDLNLLRARIGMVFQKPTPFPMSIYENIAFGVRLYEKLSRAELDERVESALRRAAIWDEVKDKLQANGLEPLRRPAAAPVHRPHRGGQAGSHPARRALLGARPDLDRQDRGADRRAQGRLHHRHRHPQHAAGGARLRLHGLHVSRRAGRVRHHQQDVHRARRPADRRTTSPAASADASAADARRWY